MHILLKQQQLISLGITNFADNDDVMMSYIEISAGNLTSSYIAFSLK